MSTAKIEKLLNNKNSEYIAVPRGSIKGMKEDKFSRKLRDFDNVEIQYPLPYQCGVYINTNENGVNETAKKLTLLPIIAEPCHIGFSGWHNFDIMVQRSSSRGIICDINPENALFLHTALKYIRHFEDRLKFIEKITQFIEKYQYEGFRTNNNRSAYLNRVQSKSVKFSLNVSDEYPYNEHTSILEEVLLEKKRTTSWLYTDARYSYIRELALEDKIALITESICAHDIFVKIGKLLSDNFIQIDTVYVSNIGEWIYTEKDRQNFLTTIRCLLTENETVLIDAQSLDGNGHTPTQRCISKKQLDKNDSLEKWFFSPKDKKTSESENDNFIQQFERLNVYHA